LFKGWDYRFNEDSSAATLFMQWENTISVYLHETTLDSLDVRLGLANHPSYQSSLYVRIKEWAEQERTIERMCFVEEL
jgi:hypothetical protein